MKKKTFKPKCASNKHRKPREVRGAGGKERGVSERLIVLTGELVRWTK